ncbi:hypothetical protein ARMA_0214 [Ardenticatena maritima]|uniref:Uncharacterized protein n=1 Tax=Ardenticatena maritima TaxID=872965 RepID=A0A0M9UBI1_9CHLR|nr:hypothetical protein ARMA_0214 [Ardenticatena maritima]
MPHLPSNCCSACHYTSCESPAKARASAVDNGARLVLSCPFRTMPYRWQPTL